jgi:CO/xanthine dehydrogenase Mo-binding subunit
VDAYGVYTNNPMAGAMRGFGVPQMAFAHESQLDQMAEKLGLSPLAIRLKNALVPGSLTATEQVLKHSVGIRETLLQAAEAAQKQGPNFPKWEVK